jgi:hypothetical protein
MAKEQVLPLSVDQLKYGDSHGCDKKDGVDPPEGCYERRLDIEHRRVEELVARITSMLKGGANHVYPFPAKDAEGKREEERERLEFSKELKAFVANHERWKNYRDTMCEQLLRRSVGKGSIFPVLHDACHLQVDSGYADALITVYIGRVPL